MKIDQTLIHKAFLREQCHVATRVCCVLLQVLLLVVLVGCGDDGATGTDTSTGAGESRESTVSDSGASSEVTDLEGGSEPTLSTPRSEESNADQTSVSASENILDSTASQRQEPMTAELPPPPAFRSRIKSPIDKLPPPEAEMTPPPPRNSLATNNLTRSKSEEAGKAYMAFIKAETTAERIKYIQRGEALKSKVEEYHTTHVQSDFKLTQTEIMGTGRRLDDPTKFVFPYYVATTKNPFGFMVLLYEMNDGMKMSWEQFVLGQDYPLHEFLIRKDTEPYEFLVAMTRAHIFDPDFSGAEKSKLIAVNIDLPRVALPDKPVAYVDSDSEIGRQLEAALPWGKRQLSRISLEHDGRGKLRVTSYAKLAHPN